MTIKDLIYRLSCLTDEQKELQPCVRIGDEFFSIENMEVIYGVECIFSDILDPGSVYFTIDEE